MTRLAQRAQARGGGGGEDAPKVGGWEKIDERVHHRGQHERPRGSLSVVIVVTTERGTSAQNQLAVCRETPGPERDAFPTEVWENPKMVGWKSERSQGIALLSSRNAARRGHG